MIPIIIEHFTYLENRFEEYVPTISITYFDWIHNPFVNLAITNPLCFQLREEEELADISSDHGLKLKHVQLPLYAFWTSAMDEYLLVGEKL